MTGLQTKALKVAPTLSRDGLFTCTMLGEALWADKRFEEWHVYPPDMQRFARPAGKLIQSLVRIGKMQADYSKKNDRRFFYRVTSASCLCADVKKCDCG